MQDPGFFNKKTLLIVNKENNQSALKAGSSATSIDVQSVYAGAMPVCGSSTMPQGRVFKHEIPVKH